jgi:hypothetical protein
MTVSYEQGFTAGERQAFKDRREHITRARPEQIRDDYGRGFWDAYFPRTLGWAARPTEVQAWWVERESEIA